MHRFLRRITRSTHSGVVNLLVFAFAGVASASCGNAEESRDTSALEPTLSIDPKPSLSIGAIAGEAVYNLDGVSRVVRLSDRSLAVASMSARTISVFDAAGDHLHTFGGHGDGPGEFARLASLWIGSGDTLGVFDSENQRISFFSPEGAFVRSIRVTLVEGAAEMLAGALPDGSYAVARIDHPNFKVGATPTADPMIVSHIGSDGVELGEMARVGGLQRLLVDNGSHVAPFSTWLVHTVADGWLVVGDGKDPVLSLINPSDQRKKLLPWIPQPIMSAKDAWQYLEALYLDPDQSPPNFPILRRRLLSDLSREDLLPTYSALLGDSEGNIWVKRYDPRIDNFWTGRPGGGPGGSWLVLTTEGDILATLDMPNGFTPKEIGADYVVGVWRDKNDVEYVHLYALHRSG